MILVDTNLLIYAVNRDAIYHETSRDLLDQSPISVKNRRV